MTKKQMGLVGNMLAILLILCFIFGNSLLSGEESGEMSASVLDVLHPVIRPAAELFSRDPVTEDQLHHLVRYIFVHIIRYRNSMISVLIHCNCRFNCLQ